ncbi:MAG: RluA family pseudouridine synthase [Treponema sp.]|nr:RluA family pseudouridine synthase [Treponema sp.]
MKKYFWKIERPQTLISFLQEQRYFISPETEGISNSKIRRLVISGSVNVNGKQCRIPSFMLLPKSTLEVFVDEEKLMYEKQPDDIQFELKQEDVLFEDEWLIIVNKPAFFPVEKTMVQDRNNLHQTVIDFLYRRNPELRNPPYVGMMHRLDKETSGAILFTKKREINGAMHDLFECHKIKKSYRAVAFNKSKREIPDTFSVEGWMKRISPKSSACKMGMSKNQDDGLFSHTDFSLVKAQGNHVHLECTLQTGRTHQIRVHLSSVGLPLVGDELYGGPEGFEENNGRIMLHSKSLEFVHPMTGQTIRAESPLPPLF